MKTRFLKAEEIEHKWFVTDASNIPLGRVAAQVARVLMGKHRPTYTPNVDSGDYVVVLNASKIRLTGKKLTQKMDFKHSGWAGGDTLKPYWIMVRDYPERTIELAVKGMLPKSRLGRVMIKKLKVFRDDQHPYQGQSLEVLTVRAT